MKYLIGWWLIVASCWAHSDDIYQYTDKNGTMVFTNKPVKNAKKVNLPPITVYASPMSKKDYTAKGYTQPATNRDNIKIYPKELAPTTVNNSVANSYGTGSYANNAFASNESGRRQILNEELLHENQALNDAEQALSTGKQTSLASEKSQPELYQARIQGLQNAVTEHQKNIDILSKQLGLNN